MKKAIFSSLLALLLICAVACTGNPGETSKNAGTTRGVQSDADKTTSSTVSSFPSVSDLPPMTNGDPSNPSDPPAPATQLPPPIDYTSSLIVAHGNSIENFCASLEASSIRKQGLAINADAVTALLKSGHAKAEGFEIRSIIYTTENPAYGKTFPNYDESKRFETLIITWHDSGCSCHLGISRTCDEFFSVELTYDPSNPGFTLPSGLEQVKIDRFTDAGYRKSTSVRSIDCNLPEIDAEGEAVSIDLTVADYFIKVADDLTAKIRIEAAGGHFDKVLSDITVMCKELRSVS